MSLVYASIPVIVKGILRDESYNCYENWVIFGLQWLGVFIYKLLNYLLIMFAMLVVQMKTEFKKQVIAMIDPRFKFKHKITTVLPVIIEASSSNIPQLFNFI